MTLLVRDEADIVDAQIAFHLNAGVDFVDRDRQSLRGRDDGDPRALRARRTPASDPGAGRRPSPERVGDAHGAPRGDEFGADWIFNTDADEFWWPLGGDFRELFAAVPTHFGVVRGAWRNFVPRPDDDRFFAERMTVRLLPTWLSRPSARHALQVGAPCRSGRAHRAREPRGLRAHSRPVTGLASDRDPPFPRALPRALHAQVRHPVRRTRAQCREGHPGSHGRGISGIPRRPARGLLSPARRGRRRTRAGSSSGELTVDTRLRDVLRSLGFGDAALGDGTSAEADPTRAAAEFAAECSVLPEADYGLASARRIDDFEARMGILERRLVSRAGRAVRSGLSR